MNHLIQRMQSSLLQLSLLLMLLTSSWCQNFEPFRSTYIEALFDDFGFEVGDDQLLEMSDMRSTSLGIGIGHNYTFTRVPTPQEVPPPLLPQALYAPGPGSTAYSSPRQQQNYYNPPSSSSSQNYYNPSSSSSFQYGPSSQYSSPPYYSSPSSSSAGFSGYTPNRRFKRQAPGFRGANSIGEHLFDDQIDFFRDPTGPFDSTGGFGQRAFDSGNTFGHFPDQMSFEQNPLRERMSKKCAPEKEMKCNPQAPYRSVDGSCNNLSKPKWGAINQALRRIVPAVYFDGYDIPRMTSKSDPRRLLPSPRLVSRNIHEPAAIRGHNLPELTNLVQVWGQYLDHDLTGTPAHKAPDGISDLKCCDGVFLSEKQQIHRDAFNGGRCHPIYIPPLDRHFTYSCMNFARSVPAKRRKDCDPNAPSEVRQQMNMLTAWVDASQVYGSTMKVSDNIRRFQKGLLKVTSDNLLPEDTNSTCVKEEPGDYCFLAGEKRVNEHPLLMALHIVFARYHNMLALKMAEINPRWSDEKIYQEVRRIIGAINQHVTYHDWLPTVLGPSIMRQYSLNVVSAGMFGPSYWKYDDKMDPTIFNAFATAAFRFGHTMIPSLFTMGGEQVRLFTMFNRPKFILKDRAQGLHRTCAGMIHDPAHHSDRFMATDLSDRLFEDKNNISMDLASLNMQRARDHGLPGYNEYRKVCGLPVYRNFDEMYESEPERAEIFRRVYDDVDDIDLFAGGLSEKPLSGGVTGPTFACLLAMQFHNIKFADRFWYETQDAPGAFRNEQLNEIRKVTLSKMMCLAIPDMGSVTVNPLYKAGSFMARGVLMPSGIYVTQNRFVPCEDLPDLNLNYWYDPGAQP